MSSCNSDSFHAWWCGFRGEYTKNHRFQCQSCSMAILESSEIRYNVCRQCKVWQREWKFSRLLCVTRFGHVSIGVERISWWAPENTRELRLEDAEMVRKTVYDGFYPRFVRSFDDVRVNLSLLQKTFHWFAELSLASVFERFRDWYRDLEPRKRFYLTPFFG